MYKLNPKIRWRWEDNNNVLLSSFLILNKTAGEILDLCNELCKNNEFCDVDGITNLIHKKYPGITLKELKKDVERMTTEFLRLGILISVKDTDKKKICDRTFFNQEIISTKFGDKLKSPMSVICEITYRCNVHCQHCGVSSFGQSLKELETNEWISIIDEMDKMGVLIISFSGGEPLLRKDIGKLITYAHQKNLRTQLFTNGLELTREKIKELEKSGLDIIRLSIDGLRETHDRFRGVNGLFDHVMDTINLLKKSKISTHIGITINKMNGDEIPDIIELLRGMDVDYFFQHIVDTGRAAYARNLLLTKKDYLNIISRIVEREKILGKPPEYPGISPTYFTEEITGCPAGRFTCTITPVGEVRACPFLTKTIVGSVKKRPLKKLWESCKPIKECPMIPR